MDKWLVKIT